MRSNVLFSIIMVLLLLSSGTVYGQRGRNIERPRPEPRQPHEVPASRQDQETSAAPGQGEDVSFFDCNVGKKSAPNPERSFVFLLNCSKKPF